MTSDSPALDSAADAPIVIDAAIDAAIDAPKLIDAAIDAPHIDAPHIDAPVDACLPTTTSGDLLLNPSFDLTSPVGVDWAQTKASSESALITSSGFYDPLDGDYDVDLGQKVSVSDSVTQSIAIPLGTTALALTGNFALYTYDYTDEVYDTATVTIVKGATTVAQAVELDNTSSYANTGYWYTFTYTFTSAQIAAVAGSTITVELASTNDFSGITHFDFDQFALNATYTVPCP